ARRRGDLGRGAERAELLALRSPLDPHFLFNTLNAIAEWCREDGEIAERAVMRLSAMLRTVLAGGGASTSALWRGGGGRLAGGPRSSRSSIRCPSCTGCAIPTASV